MSFKNVIETFWDNQALTASEESVTNGNILDLETSGAVDAQLGMVWLNILVGTAEDGTLVSGGHFQLVTSDDITFTSGNTGATTSRTGDVQAIGCIGSAADPLFPAELQSGKRYSIAVPTRILMKYTQLEWIAVSESAGAMTIDAWLGMEPLSDLNIQKEPT